MNSQKSLDLLRCELLMKSPEVILLFIFVSRIIAFNLSFNKDFYAVSLRQLKYMFSGNFRKKKKQTGKKKV